MCHVVKVVKHLITPAAVTISNEVINGTSKECIKVLSPLMAQSKGRPMSNKRNLK